MGYHSKFLFPFWIKTEPKNDSEKYIFLVDSASKALALVGAGFRSVVIEKESNENNYTLNSFSGEEVFANRYSGWLSEITFVLCLSKKSNEELKRFLDSLDIKSVEGWQLFEDWEESAPIEEKQFKFAICDFISRFSSTNKYLNLLQFHHISENGIAKKPFDSKIRDYILETYPLFIIGSIPYLYSNGVYEADVNGTRVKQIIEGCLLEQFRTHHNIQSVYNLILDTNSAHKNFDDVNCFPETWICFSDCMFDTKNKEVIPHDPKYLCVNQIPHSYKRIVESNSGDSINDFLDFIACETDREMLLQYAGLCMTKDTKQQKFLVLCGLGGTGKSLLCRLFEKMVGRKNISNVSLQELNKRFSTSLLCGVLLNSCADLPAEALEDSAVVKKLLGEDSLLAERKGQDAFMFKSYAKLLFSTNSLPQVLSERTNGFWRRLLILKMDKMPERPDPNLFSRLESEILYFIKLSVEALCRMHESGLIAESDNSKKAVKQMRKDSDVVQGWIDDNCIVDGSCQINRSEAFSDFEIYCKTEERQALTKNGFFAALRTKNFVEKRGKTDRYFIGLALKSDGKCGDFVQISDAEMEQLPFF